MPIIMISRGSFEGARDLAERLAAKLGYDYLSREELSDFAVQQGVPVGRLRRAMVRPPRVYGRLGKERDLYLACITARLCELARNGNLVYHGHAAHLLLPDVTHVFRVRVVADVEFRIRSGMARLNLRRGEVKEHIEKIDEERARWVRFLFGVDWDDPNLYDVTLNIKVMGVENAAAALTAMAALPNFKATPASMHALENRLLAARARFRLGMDKRTAQVGLNVRADDGVVTVTYPPYQAEVSPRVPEVLAGLEGVKEVDCAIAETNILWIQEACDPTSDVCKNIVEMARKWDAAVELMRFVPTAEDIPLDASGESPASPSAEPVTVAAGRDGGIAEDIDLDEQGYEDAGLSTTLDRLVQIGRSAGVSLVHGSPRRLLGTIDRRIEYSLVVLGDMFLGKAPEVRRRLRFELLGLLTDNLESPVIDAALLRSQLRFGRAATVRLVVFAIAAAALYLLVFTNQAWVLQRVAGGGSILSRVLGVALLVTLVPIVAYTYGTFARLMLRAGSSWVGAWHRSAHRTGKQPRA